MAPAMESPALVPLLTRMARENAHAWLTNFKLLRAPDPPTAARLDQIKAPTLLVVGDRDTPTIHAVVDTLARRLANPTTVVIPGAGHLANLENPARFDAEVLAFLRHTGRP